jgi:hypothetical protein
LVFNLVQRLEISSIITNLTILMGPLLSPKEISLRKYKVMLLKVVRDILEVSSSDLNTLELELSAENRIDSCIPVSSETTGDHLCRDAV